MNKKRNKEIYVYSRLSDYLGLLIFLLILGSVFLYVFITSFVTGNDKMGFRFVALLLLTVFNYAFAIFECYLFRNKIIIQDNKIRAKKWYGRWHEFGINQVDKIFICRNKNTVCYLKLYAGKFCDVYVSEKVDFDKMHKWFKDNLQEDKIFVGEKEKKNI